MILFVTCRNIASGLSLESKGKTMEKGFISNFKQIKTYQYISLFVLYCFLVQLGTCMTGGHFSTGHKRCAAHKQTASSGLWDNTLRVLKIVSGIFSISEAEAAPEINEADLCPDQYRWGDPVPGYSYDNWPVFESWMEVHLVNVGAGDAFNVTATITYAPIYVTVVDGDVSLGDIPAGSGAWSAGDTFTLHIDMDDPQPPDEGVCWRVEYDDAAGAHHIIEDVAEFCGEQCSGTAANHPPVITSTPVTDAAEGELYAYVVKASDPDPGDTLTYSLTVAPVGMTINSTAGLIDWTPTAAQVGDNPVTVEVSDGRGGLATQEFIIAVAAAPPARIEACGQGYVGAMILFDANADDIPNGDCYVSLATLVIDELNGQPLSPPVTIPLLTARAFGTQINLALLEAQNLKEEVGLCIDIITFRILSFECLR